MKKIDLKEKNKEIKSKTKTVFKDYIAFLSKGNTINLAVGLIIGTSFTAIVNALANHIFYPLINYLLSLTGSDNILENARTILGNPVYLDEASGLIDWDSTCYIDWGAFITSLIDFIIIGTILFIIIKACTKANKTAEILSNKAKEAYYQKHPDEKPIVEEKPIEPTDHELLKEIVAIMKEEKSGKKRKKEK